MGTKDETIAILQELKGLKISRRQIERELNYSVRYIDTQLTKGSNPKLLQALKQFHKDTLHKMADPLPKILQVLEEMKAEVSILFEREIARYAKEKSIPEEIAREHYDQLKKEKMRKR